MSKFLLRFNLVFVFLISITITYAQNSNLIYEHVLEIQDEFQNEAIAIFHQNDLRGIPIDASKYVSKAEYFRLEDSFVQNTKKDRPNTLFLEIPVQDNTLKVQLYKREITTSSYQVRTVSGEATIQSKSIFYGGIIKGDKNSIVSLAITNDALRMTIADEKGNFEINKISEDLYAGYSVSDSKHSQDTGCSTDHNYKLENTKIKDDKGNNTRFGDCVEIYLECDFDSFNSNGASVQNTEDWALSIINEVGMLYEDVGIPLVVSDILVYDAPDPYLAGGSSGDVLDLMGPVIGNNYNGRLAHVFSTRSIGGGIAWVDVLCDVNSGGSFGPYAVSGSMNPGVVPFPIFSWNVMVVAHELGHNFGSFHTHDCVWNGNNTQIDDCGNVETDDGESALCFDENNPILPNAGTIMSYCHLAGGIGIDFNLGFHEQVGDLLFNRYTGAPCSTGDNCDGGGNAPIADFAFNQLNDCNPVEVQFTDLSTNEPSTYFWSFPGGTPASSAEQNPFVIYNEPGFYDVTLTVSNFSGENTLTLSQIIEVFENPILAFDSEVVDGVMKFTNQTTGSVFSYFWDFGDGNSSTEENPCHEYDEDGNYTVTLSIGSICGSFDIEDSVDFFTLPTAGYEADTTFGCNPLEVNFTSNSSENTVDHLWTFEGGNPETSTQENPTITYESAGVFDVTLIVSNDQGSDTMEMIDYISIEEIPTNAFEYVVDSLEVMFTNLSQNYDTLTWDFGDGNTSTMTSPTHTYEEEGTYDISLTISNMCDTLTTTQTIVLSSLPIAGYSASIEEGCLPLTVEFSNNSSLNSDSWEWSFPGGTPANSTEENPTVVYNETGVFDVTLVVSNESGEDVLTETDLISVQDIPSADFDFTTDNLEVAFIDISMDYDNLNWDFGDGNSSNDIDPTHTFNEDGSYEVVLSATNECGTDTKTITVSVSSLPTAGFSANIQEECVPFVVEFNNSSSSNVTEFNWSFPGGTPSESTEENPIISYESAGTYDVELIVNSDAGADTLMMDSYIISNDLPNADFEYDALSDFEYSFTNGSTNGDTYTWDFGDGMTSMEENPTHIYEEAGTYNVVLSVVNNCGEEIHEDEIMIIETSSIDQNEIVSNMLVFPNPNNGTFSLSVDSKESGVLTMDIYNTLGQLVLSDLFLINSGSNQKNIELQNPISGVYFIMLGKGSERQVKRLFLD